MWYGFGIYALHVYAANIFKKWESWASKFLAGPVNLEAYWSCWPVQNTILILTLNESEINLNN